MRRQAMIRQYSYRELMLMLNDKKFFIMKQVERYFFAQIIN